MRPRRTLLLFAIAFALAAAVASVSAVTRDRSGAPAGDERERAGRGRVAGGREDGRGTVSVAFDAAARPPHVKKVERRAHVIVTVRVPKPGQVTLQGLGVTTAADAHAPAVFDLLVEERGRFAVEYEPVEGRERRAGTLVVAP